METQPLCSCVRQGVDAHSVPRPGGHSHDGIDTGIAHVDTALRHRVGWQTPLREMHVSSNGIYGGASHACHEVLPWNCVECTRLSNVEVKPTPAQVKAEVWMALIHGSRGLIYFVHQFKPKFIEAGLLADAEMAEAVGGINEQIHRLAVVLNSPAVEGALTVTAEPAEVSPDRRKLLHGKPISAMVKRHNGATYVFAVRMENSPAKGTFSLAGLTGKAAAEVLSEGRTLEVMNGAFHNDFAPWAVHLYRVR